MLLEQSQDDSVEERRFYCYANDEDYSDKTKHKVNRASMVIETTEEFANRLPDRYMTRSSTSRLAPRPSVSESTRGFCATSLNTSDAASPAYSRKHPKEL